jgi:hypothetical protein
MVYQYQGLPTTCGRLGQALILRTGQADNVVPFQTHII